MTPEERLKQLAAECFNIADQLEHKRDLPMSYVRGCARALRRYAHEGLGDVTAPISVTPVAEIPMSEILRTMPRLKVVPDDPAKAQLAEKMSAILNAEIARLVDEGDL